MGNNLSLNLFLINSYIIKTISSSLSLSSSLPPSSSSSVSLSLPPIISSNNELNLLAIGDWGGSARSPYYTQAQKINSDGMSKVADMINPEAVISLGDNFYYVGLSLDNVDERYKATFEDVSFIF